MTIELEINGSADAVARYVTFAPSPCRVRQTDATSPSRLTLTSEAVRPGGGEVVFYPAPGAPAQETLELEVPPGDTGAEFWIGGKWEHPSVEDRDCRVVASIGGEEKGSIELMVRVRKNANLLMPAERDRFVAAFGRLNNRGQGKFAQFRAMHVSVSDPQAHRGPHFLPWHRSYLLDLERSLQEIDPSVALHYWRWDEPAPNVFQRSFMGVADEFGRVEFTPGHPLSSWTTDGVPGIRRSPHFATATSRASFEWNGATLMPRGQAETLALGEPGNVFPLFADERDGIEGNPHGWAHVSFDGFISSIPTAARDPLFFMLHSNVDRLWALWQWTFGRTDADDPDVYTGEDFDGRRLDDTMWPWNGVTGFPRPDFAPGNGLATSPAAAAPATAPTIRSMIDPEGRHDPLGRLGYGYDTVPFEHG